MAQALQWSCAQCERWTGQTVTFTTYRTAAEHLVEKHGNRAASFIAGTMEMTEHRGMDILWEKLTKPANE